MVSNNIVSIHNNIVSIHDKQTCINKLTYTNKYTLCTAVLTLWNQTKTHEGTFTGNIGKLVKLVLHSQKVVVRVAIPKKTDSVA